MRSSVDLPDAVRADEAEARARADLQGDAVEDDLWRRGNCRRRRAGRATDDLRDGGRGLVARRARRA